ncbi:MAG: NAD(P)H-dependent glycerol-3-phosphate dehydrogenase [Flavobacteriales bacterium]|nr:NAD(P)H-dependent glycerol-3-phosphate dehydrogenase [Flavobacteriales bacterium]
MKNSVQSISILGGGSWATAIAKILCENTSAKKINWWVRTPEKADYMRTFHHNPDYISSVSFVNQPIEFFTNLEDCISEGEIIILAIPSAFVHQTLSGISPQLYSDKYLISAVKGLIPETSQILGDYLREHCGINDDHIGVITGPCHAEEVALEKLSFLTLASKNQNLANEISKLLQGRFIKTVTSDDIYGTEYAAVLKNIYAIAAGITHGLGFGDNFLAVLVSNAIRETKRFMAAVHPIERDIDDSAYLGDLMVTAYSQFSRNRTFGNMLGKGYSVKSAQIEMKMVAEGYYATKTIYEMNQKFGVKMPISDFVYRVIYANFSAKKAVETLISQID